MVVSPYTTVTLNNRWGMDASGMLPNIYCNHVPLEQLRRHPRFNSLPPPEDLVLGDSAEYRCSIS